MAIVSRSQSEPAAQTLLLIEYCSQFTIHTIIMSNCKPKGDAMIADRIQTRPTQSRLLSAGSCRRDGREGDSPGHRQVRTRRGYSKFRVLIALAKALGVSLSYLLDTQGIELSGVEFRTKANTTAKDRAQVETEVLEWIERYLQIELILDLDSAKWQCPVPCPVKLERHRRSRATRQRSSRNMETRASIPIPNMTELLEEKGLKVLTVPLARRVSGFTCMVGRGEGNPLPVIVVNDQFSLERRRLTLAHELAHRLIDTDSLSEKDEEKAANLFAGAFLMPREHLLNEVGKHRNALGYKEMIDLKHLYRVSGMALLMRLRQLDVISESDVDLRIPDDRARMAHAGTRGTGKARKARAARAARRFERLCYRALAEGLISLSKAAELFRLPVLKSRPD